MLFTFTIKSAMSTPFLIGKSLKNRTLVLFAHREDRPPGGGSSIFLFGENLWSSACSWTHSLAVRGMGVGLEEPHIRLIHHGLVRRTGVTPNLPYLCICGSSGWAR